MFVISSVTLHVGIVSNTTSNVHVPPFSATVTLVVLNVTHATSSSVKVTVIVSSATEPYVASELAASTHTVSTTLSSLSKKSSTLLTVTV